MALNCASVIVGASGGSHTTLVNACPATVARMVDGETVRIRREARREELLAAAIEVIRRGGADATMEEMADAGGISKPILYRHFRDRDGLVAAISEQAMAQLAAILDERMGDRNITGRDGVRATIDAFFEYIERDTSLYHFVVENDMRHGGQATLAFTEQNAEHVAALLRDGLAAAVAIRPPPTPGRAASSVSCTEPPRGGWPTASACPARRWSTSWSTWCGAASAPSSCRPDDVPSRLFVYGTLMPGRLRWPALERLRRGVAGGHRAPARSTTRARDGRWRRSPPDGGRRTSVTCPACSSSSTRPPRRGARVLDAVEDTATRRAPAVEVVTADGAPAWAYHFPHPPTAWRAIDRWDASSTDPLDANAVPARCSGGSGSGRTEGLGGIEAGGPHGRGHAGQQADGERRAGPAASAATGTSTSHPRLRA